MSAQPADDGEVYATLLLNDAYLPGAVVLAHSLRDAGATRKLAVLVTPDTVSAGVITELETVYDHIISVPRIQNSEPANLNLMNRADLHSAFTKIHLWKQTQFRKIVYIDADVVAYRAPDELFDLPHAFSAAPDIGWPDLFNTGVMVLTPNMGDFHAMLAMAERGISFDGADQGLINMHFKNTYNRISFTYNVTPSAHYQYLPAYKHFQSSINMVHFIGAEKPWFQGRDVSHGSGSPYNEMTGRWWAVYDKHYRGKTSTGNSSSTSMTGSQLVQYFTKGEWQPNGSQGQQHLGGPNDQYPGQRSVPFQPSSSTWDAQRHAPPSGSRPEAANLPVRSYRMSSDVTPFVAPTSYPSPPSNMGYQNPRPEASQKPNPIFPWESDQAPPSRVFHEDAQQQSVEQPTLPSLDTSASVSVADQDSQQATPTTPTAQGTSSDPWTSYARSNAWDEVPEIERYVEAIREHRRSRSRKSPGRIALSESGAEDEQGQARRPSMKLTDFPGEDERPSLPVTPAPIRRAKFWGVDGPDPVESENDPLLPTAKGVPTQTDWDPAEQLQKLAKQQSAALLQRLGDQRRGSVDLPARSLPFGSEDLTSPTYVFQAPPALASVTSPSDSTPRAAPR